MVERNTFDNDIRSRFEGFAPEPPAELWLAVQDAVVVAPPRRLVPIFFRVAAAVVFLTIGGLSVWFLSNNNTSTSPFAENQQQPETQSGTDTYSPSVPATANNTLPDGHVTPAQQASSALPGNTPANQLPAAITTPDQLHGLASAYADAHERYSSQYAALQPIGHTALLAQQDRSVSPRQNTPTRMTGAGTSLAWNTYTSNTRQSGQRSTGGLVLGLHVSPQYNDRHIAASGVLPGTAMPVGAFEKQSVSYGYGISAAYPLTNRLSVQAGLSYKNMDQRISDINAFSRFDNQPFYDADFAPGLSHPQNVVTSFGVIKFGSPDLYFTDAQSSRVKMSDTKFPFDVPEDGKLLLLEGKSLSQSFSFVEVPLLVRYKLLSFRQIDLQLKVGLAGNILVRNDVLIAYMNSTSERIGQTEGVRDLSFSGIGGLSLTWPITKNFGLFVEPGAQMFLQPISTNNTQTAQTKTYPYSFSVYSGISFRF